MISPDVAALCVTRVKAKYIWCFELLCINSHAETINEGVVQRASEVPQLELSVVEKDLMNCNEERSLYVVIDKAVEAVESPAPEELSEGKLKVNCTMQPHTYMQLCYMYMND